MAKTDIRCFNYKKVGQLDADMWRAYYNHQFVKLFRLLLLLVKNQLGLNWFLTVRLVYYSTWAAVDYRVHKQSGTNNKRILKNLTHFYSLLSRYNTDPFNYRKAAELELAWWEIHRKSYKNNLELEQSLAHAVATVYNIQAESLKKYAHYRAEAMILPQHKGDKPERVIDWQEVTELTIKSWQSLHEIVCR